MFVVARREQHAVPGVLGDAASGPGHRESGGGSRSEEDLDICPRLAERAAGGGAGSPPWY
eukprot:139699-Prorocentrum_minimum.AAC.3